MSATSNLNPEPHFTTEDLRQGDINRVFNQPVPRSSTPMTHDYSKRYWGHDYFINEVIDGGRELKMGGWGYDIKADDYLIIQHADPEVKTTRYLVKKVRYERDPADMWWAEVEFAPRLKEEKRK